MEYARALAVANELREILLSGCEKIEIAGSVRRKKENVGDLELVAIPREERVPGMGLFTYQDGESFSALEICINEMVRDPKSEWKMDAVLRRNGPKYKRLRHVGTGVCCDLFIVTPETWGPQMAIRTGPADFSHMLVTRALRMGMKQEDGRLWRVHRDGTKVAIDTPEEVDFFKALGLEYLPPNMRGKVLV